MGPSQGSRCSPRRTSHLSLQVGSFWNDGTTIWCKGRWAPLMGRHSLQAGSCTTPRDESQDSLGNKMAPLMWLRQRSMCRGPEQAHAH